MVTRKSDAMDARERVRHHHAIGAGDENQAVLIGQRAQCRCHAGLLHTKRVANACSRRCCAGVAQRLDDDRSHLSLECVH